MASEKKKGGKKSKDKKKAAKGTASSIKDAAAGYLEEVEKHGSRLVRLDYVAKILRSLQRFHRKTVHDGVRYVRIVRYGQLIDPQDSEFVCHCLVSLPLSRTVWITSNCEIPSLPPW